MCDENSFVIVDIKYDSTELQFVASEQYLRDISLLDKRSYIVDPANSLFSEEQIDFFKNRAIELNKKEDGDSMSCLLKKSKSG